jgi:2-polyprenyl-3-methyl-5-hydroxy-6-metoxy-1,4-benzoquinol methylase
MQTTFMENYKLQATNPTQYDSPELDWRIDGNANSTSRLFFRNNLKEHLEDLTDKTVLDIGSGIGHLFPMLFEFGAKEVYGIEPSKRNIETSKQLYPNVEVYQGSLEDFVSDKKFDIAVSIMVFEHIWDIDEAFQKIAGLLKDNGKFYLIFGDKDFHILNRPKAEVDVQPISDNIVSTKTIRPTGTMYDIFRSTNLYIDTAQKTGFKIFKQVGLISPQPKHSFYGEKPICHLLICKKV